MLPNETRNNRNRSQRPLKRITKQSERMRMAWEGRKRERARLKPFSPDLIIRTFENPAAVRNIYQPMCSKGRGERGGNEIHAETSKESRSRPAAHHLPTRFCMRPCARAPVYVTSN